MNQLITLKTGRRVWKGLIPTSRGRLLAARPFRRTATPPAQLCNSNGTPMQMDFNDQYGDCTCACLGNVLDVIKRILKYTGGAIPDAAVLSWAKAHGFQDGANIPDVLAALQTDPMTDAAGQPNFIGPYVGVNYADAATVYGALSEDYALDLGVDAGPLQDCVGNDPVCVMPILSRPYTNLDHSIPAFDYGTAGWLAAQYANLYKFNVQLGSVPSNTPCIGMETWGVMVIAPVVSFQAITGESWAIESFPAPGNVPTPTPTPTPTPVPTPTPGPTRRAARLMHHAAEQFSTGGADKALELLRYGEQLFGLD